MLFNVNTGNVSCPCYCGFTVVIEEKIITLDPGPEGSGFKSCLFSSHVQL